MSQDVSPGRYLHDPIMAAAATGGPVAGFLSNRFRLRAIARLALDIAAFLLTFLGFSDFHSAGLSFHSHLQYAA